MLLLLIASMAIYGHHFNKLVSRSSLTRLSFEAARRQNIWARGQFNIGVVCYGRRRIVAYSAYIFKALGETLARGLCGMHPSMMLGS